MPTSREPMTQTAENRSDSAASRPRVHPHVAVTLLETIRTLDLPTEVLEEEDPAVTMPRRLGLSDAVEQQIRRYREAARKRRRITDTELRNLILLAIRRPDSKDVFFLAGGSLVTADHSRMSRLLPSPVGYALARRRVRRTLKALFGRSLGGFGSGPFTFEGRALPFIQSDPGGDACELVTGLAQASVRRYVSEAPPVSHVDCQALGADVCRWAVVEESEVRISPASDRSSEFGAGEEG